MPTLLTTHGLKFYFYSDEHLPIHVHVLNADGRAKIQIEPEVELIENRGIKSKDLQRALTIARIYRNFITEKWYDYFLDKR